jgi:hypothetical protein
MRLLACGGRNFNDRDFVFETLDRIHAKRPVTLLIQGGASGADSLARQWAIIRGVPFKTEYAEWKKYKRAAGPIRNGVMLEKYNPEGVVAFPGNDGTADMVKQATDYGLVVWQPPYVPKGIVDA